MGAASSRAFRTFKSLADRRDAASVPDELRRRWSTPVGASSSDEAARRLDRIRCEIIPWLHRTRPLPSARVLEVGCGGGLSTVALGEQLATVTAIDESGDAVQAARERCAAHGVRANVVTLPAAAVSQRFRRGELDWIMFWAVLEHMTVQERIDALAVAWSMLDPGGLLTVIETPNRLWYYDSHTSQLPFYLWLPDELAFQVAELSPRPGFGDVYRGRPSDDDLRAFARRGRGVSFHEIHVAVGPPHELEVVSCLQTERRARSQLRRVGFAVSRAGRYERFLRRVSDGVPRAFLQPFLYLTIRKG